VAGAMFSGGPPSFTWVNDGLRVHYSWRHPVAAAAAAAGAAVLGLSLRRPVARTALALLALGALLLAADRLRYRLEAGGEGIAERSLLGSTRMAWSEVGRVDSRADGLVVTAVSAARISVPTRGWPPHDVAQLERTIARRVREAAR